MKNKQLKKLPEKNVEEFEKIIKTKELILKLKKIDKKKDIMILVTPRGKDHKEMEERGKENDDFIENKIKYIEKQKEYINERIKVELEKKQEELNRKNKMEEEILTMQLIMNEEDQKINKDNENEKEEEEEEEEEKENEEKIDEINDFEQEKIIEKEKMPEKKCSHEDHKENGAISFCQECNIFMCNKCDKLHLELFKNHHKYIIDKNINDIFTGLCQENNHSMNLDYFCKNHNKLCCAACLCKVKGNGNGDHKNCEVCFISDIKEKKRNILKNNIKYLKKISNSIEPSIQKLKNIYQNMNENKENLKLEIGKVFTKIRNKINEREDQIFLEVDNLYEKIYFKEELIKGSENLPNEIKLSLEKGITIDREWDNQENKLNSLINDCIKIENIIYDINQLNKNLKKINFFNDLVIKFCPDDDEINYFLDIIENFGYVYFKRDILQF